MDLRELFKDRSVGGITALGLLQWGEPDHIEEDMAELLRGIDVEFLPRQLIDLST